MVELSISYDVFNDDSPEFEFPPVPHQTSTPPSSKLGGAGAHGSVGSYSSANSDPAQKVRRSLHLEVSMAKLEARLLSMAQVLRSYVLTPLPLSHIVSTPLMGRLSSEYNSAKTESRMSGFKIIWQGTTHYIL